MRQLRSQLLSSNQIFFLSSDFFRHQSRKLCDTNFRPQIRQDDFYRFFVAENESANEIAFSRHILEKIDNCQGKA